MDWSARQQLKIIGLILLLVLSIVIIVWLFVSRPNRIPTCFDGRQNSEEMGVDCGGGCALLCREQTRDLVVLWHVPLRVTDGLYNAVAYIENQNAAAGIQELLYRFRLYDEQDQVITEKEGSISIPPNQRIGVFESGIVTKGTAPVRAFFEIIGTQKWERTPARFSTEQLVVEGSVYDAKGFNAKLIATLRNPTLQDIADISVVALLYDQHKNVVASSRTYVREILHGTSTPLVFTWPEKLLLEPARIEIIPLINVFHDVNQEIQAR
ncbi:MAG: hypothetical protein ACI83D_000406 [Planctomycetota bacterium]|jgi:hypothetical protein